MKRREVLDQARRLTIREINAKITECRQQLFTLNQDRVLGKLKDVAQIGRIKRDIARYATILDQKVAAEVEK